ncbi:DUF6708 domain-containing protein [Pseudomonas sp. KNUC1026]|uniref:DUF6708 domain-containing protein n=1 Tax=Pseudomonas sp. KNUC1026 TaxID=2893890 RepID=UPI001F263A11|nr:DUF6708 domain-containing protein [Pseudomonas sp. KNUC1026]UFH50105.1 hypothetical protein LN139_01730 [Pseudomonas sp. KNUC1026]
MSHVFASELHNRFDVNGISEIYLEARRPFAMFRELMGLIPVMFSIMTIYCVCSVGFFFKDPDMESVLFYMLSLAISVWCTAISFRFVLSTPRDNPIRFNRVRQKIYAYNTNPNWLLPWRKCPVDIAIYDWSQVRAEYFFINMKNFSGEGIMLSIVKPGTSDVIDRFPLRFGAQDASLWNYICTYMQHGPSALPPFTTPETPTKSPPTASSTAWLER